MEIMDSHIVDKIEMVYIIKFTILFMPNCSFKPAAHEMGHTMGMRHPSDTGRDCKSMTTATGGDDDPWSQCGIDDFVDTYEAKKWGAGRLECLDANCPVSYFGTFSICFRTPLFYM